jgi:hypothetical protein
MDQHLESSYNFKHAPGHCLCEVWRTLSKKVITQNCFEVLNLLWIEIDGSLIGIQFIMSAYA